MKEKKFSLYLQVLKQSNQKYSANRVTGNILILRNTKNSKLQERVRLQIFMELSKMIVKAVNNFNYLTRNVPDYKRLHDNEDIVNECYVVLNRCLETLKIEYIKTFYFYYNNALNKAIYRIYKNDYAAHFDVMDIDEEREYILTNRGYEQKMDFSVIDLRSLLEIEKEVIKFKLSGKKMSIFLEEWGMTSDTFNQILACAKEKLKNLYNDSTYFRTDKHPD